MRIRLLGVQISLIWVVFCRQNSYTTVAASCDVGRECLSSTAICCRNLLNSHYDYQRTSADLKNKHSTPDTRVVEVVY